MKRARDGFTGCASNYLKFDFGVARHQVWTTPTSQDESRKRAQSKAAYTNRRRAAIKRLEANK